MGDGRSSTMPSSAERMSAPMLLMAIIVLLSSGPTTMMCVGTVLVFFSVGVMPVCIEVLFFSSCDERQMF